MCAPYIRDASKCKKVAAYITLSGSALFCVARLLTSETVRIARKIGGRNRFPSSPFTFLTYTT